MAAATLESPSLYAEGPFEQEDVIYPCKACGEILEEGKAYELAGNRWHIDCFRCNTCNTLLDSDANLLLLGDGSLICNNCTYSCSACGDKIEDLAILTGDQAYCSGCFRCRNCKKKIEYAMIPPSPSQSKSNASANRNLRYARTSQGIFCMSCHESLMARRRKKSKASTKPAQNGTGSGTTKEKALPSLPPQDLSSADRENVAADKLETSAMRPPPERQLRSRKDGLSDMPRELAPLSANVRNGEILLHGNPKYMTVAYRSADEAILPASTYGDGKRSTSTRDLDTNEEQGFLPMAFDPSPIAPPLASRSQARSPNDFSLPIQSNTHSRDYFSRTSGKPHMGRREDERPESEKSSHSDKDVERPANKPKTSGHISSQDKSRQLKNVTSTSKSSSPPDSAFRERTESARAPEPLSATLVSKEFSQPQDPSKIKTSISRNGSNAEQKIPRVPVGGSDREESKNKSSSKTSSADQFLHTGLDERTTSKQTESTTTGTTPSASLQPERLARGDSLTASSRSAAVSTPEPQYSSNGTISSLHFPERKTSAASNPTGWSDAHSPSTRRPDYSPATDSPAAPTILDSPPPRSSSRPAGPIPVKKPLPGDRSAGSLLNVATSPQTPLDRRPPDSVTSKDILIGPPLSSPSLASPTLPKSSLDGGFSMEEEMVRIMNGGLGQTSEGAARRSSNAAKHARSFSDRGLSSAGRASANGTADGGTPLSISSPMLSNTSGQDSSDTLLAQLRRAHRRIAELEAANALLHEKVDSSNEIKAATNELREKRTTIVVLDTQREMVVRELEAMTEHLTRAKNSNQPLDLNALKTDILKDFVESLQKLKNQMSAQIEDLIHKRNELTTEIGNLIQMKDKGFQEYESLSTKNSQLLEMNDQILQNIQQMYKSTRGASGGANGLGIYNAGSRPEISGPTEVRHLNLAGSDLSMATLLNETEAGSATVLQGPQVVNIRKAQPKRFNWRKGGEKVAKGLKGAFTKDENAMPYTATIVGGDTALRQGSDANKFPFFNQKPGTARPGELKSSGSSGNLAQDASVLFGSDLEARCDFERRVVPAVVSRCIEEVESRGMDMEGIYRKSGGSGQVKVLQQGFEKDGNYDISDPDLDIHAVTSALKQYFRKLPVPLVTYDAYESMLEAGKIDDSEKQIAALRGAISDLPDAHRNCLELLFSHLSRVVDRQATNLMTPLNLSVVFAPTIMRPLSIEREMSDMQMQRAAVQALLEHREAVFRDEE